MTKRIEYDSAKVTIPIVSGDDAHAFAAIAQLAIYAVATTSSRVGLDHDKDPAAIQIMGENVTEKDMEKIAAVIAALLECDGVAAVKEKRP